MATETPTHVGRFEWERALLDSTLPWHTKAFLLLLGTKMDTNGTNCRPSAPWLMSKMGRSRQRVFELFEEAEAAGWIATISRPGKPSVRLPRIPNNPSDVSDGLAPADARNPSDGSDGLGVEMQPHPSDTSYGSQDPRNRPHPSDPSDGTRQTHLTQPTKTNQVTGGTLPPDPLRPEAPQASPRTEPEQEPDQSKTSPTEVDPETHVPQRAARVRCEHGLAAGVVNGKPRCPLCRRTAPPVAEVIELRPERSAS